MAQYQLRSEATRKALDLAESGHGITPVTVAEAASEYEKLLRDTGRENEAQAVEKRAAAFVAEHPSQPKTP